MKRPSIFSSNYKETVKRIRRRNTLIAILILCILITIYVIFNDRINKFFIYRNNDLIDASAPENQDTQNFSNTQEVNTSKENITDKTFENTQKISEEQFYTLQLSSGRNIKIYYEEKNKEKLFTGLSDDTDYISLSPSKKKACIIDKENQDMYIMNNDNTFVNITMNVYTAFGRPNEKYYKPDQLLRFNNDYLWHDMAKFLNEDKVAYRSRLPYFITNDYRLYLWVYDLSINNHQCIFALEPGDIQIQDLDKTGLKIVDSGNNYYLKPDNTIVMR